MDRFFQGKLKMNLAQIVQQIDSGEADDIIDSMSKNTKEINKRTDKAEKSADKMM